MLFDTLELSKALQTSFTPEQAETLVHALGKASVDQLATKSDIVGLKGEIAELRGELRSEIAGLRGELRSEIAGLRGELRSEIAGLRGELQSEIAGLRGELQSEIVDVRGKIEALEANLTGIIIAQNSLLRADTVKWIVSALAFNFIGTAGLIITMTKAFGK